MQSISTWASKCAFSHPLHPRLEISPSNRAHLIGETQSIFQAPQLSLPPTNDTRQDASSSVPSLPSEKISSAPAKATPKQRFQSFNTPNWITDAAGSYLVFIATLAILVLWAILG